MSEPDARKYGYCRKGNGKACYRTCGPWYDGYDLCERAFFGSWKGLLFVTVVLALMAIGITKICPGVDWLCFVKVGQISG